jgi:hypothetical protein
MRIRTVLFAILALFGASLASHAGVAYTVSLDTTALVGFGPFGLAFQFADGSGTGDGNNAVILSGFQFGVGGAPLGVQSIFTGVGESGSLSDTVTMIDNEPTGSGYFAQLFTPGAMLSFQLESTTNVDPGGIFDLFTFGITDSFFNYIPTTAGDGTDLLSLTLDDPLNPTIATYSTTYPDFTDFALGPPLVTGVGEVPEPATWLPVGLILGGAWCRRRWRARR